MNLYQLLDQKEVVKVKKSAKKKKITTIGLTGKNKSVVWKESDYCIAVPSKETSHIQEMHIIVLHLLCILIEKNI